MSRVALLRPHATRACSVFLAGASGAVVEDQQRFQAPLTPPQRQGDAAGFAGIDAWVEWVVRLGSARFTEAQPALDQGCGEILLSVKESKVWFRPCDPQFRRNGRRDQDLAEHVARPASAITAGIKRERLWR